MRKIAWTILLLVVLLPAWTAGCDKARQLIGGKGAAEEPKAAEPGKGEPAAEPAKAEAPASRTVAMVIAFEGYQDKELEVPKGRFEAAGFSVQTVSYFAGTATGSLGGKAKVDLLLEDAVKKVDDYAAVVFVGGPGSVFYHKEKLAHQFARDAAGKGKVVAAICLAPFTLAYAGVLKGVKATAWTGGEFTPERLGAEGAYFRDEPVVVENRIVTANGPAAAADFADAVIGLLK
jgi:protease I